MLAARIPFAAAAGVLCSLAVFFGLWRLVGVPLNAVATATQVVPEFTRQIVETPVQPKPRRTKPEREPPPEAVDPPRAGPGDNERVVHVRPDLIRILGPSRIGRAEGGGLPMGVDRDAMPLVRVDPVYPPSLEARGIEGWVRVQFNVAATGTVRDVIVVASEPRDAFDEAALEAIARWRYNPRIAGGTAVERVGLQTLIRFTIQGPR
ncbi:MAG TPA: TonB family protein [Gammaproteobacteria bacterium]|nr:TonB family protein [Gammaproteobacteria bacterium]